VDGLIMLSDSDLVRLLTGGGSLISCIEDNILTIQMMKTTNRKTMKVIIAKNGLTLIWWLGKFELIDS